LGDPGQFAFDQGRYKNATAGDVQKAVAQWLDSRNRLLVRFHPEKSGRPAEVALDRSKAPALGADTAFRAPEVKSARLANGLELLVAGRHDLPRAAVALVARAGGVADPAGKDGTAYLTAETMVLGTKSRQALQIETAMGDLGTSFSTLTGRESAQVGFEVLKRNLEPALGILADVVLNPTFVESEVAREKKLHLDRPGQQERNGNAVAARLRAMRAFGPSHPYGRPVQGLPGTVSGITRGDLEAFHRARYSPLGSALVFTGDVTLSEAQALA